jgi:hypothetical protein
VGIDFKNWLQSADEELKVAWQWQPKPKAEVMI